MRTIELSRGQVALFGYGSLLCIQSLEKTLGRRYDGPLESCWLTGWRRIWNVFMPNTGEYYAQLDNDRFYPTNIVYLNIRRSPEDRLHGVLFVITQDDLASVDAREWIYKRHDVSDVLSGMTVTGGPAFAYVGKPQYHYEATNSPHHAAVRATYLATIELGLQALGENFRTLYEASSDPIPQHLVIEDHRDNFKRDPTTRLG